MEVPAGFSPTLILVLNLAGTFVFGLSGGLAAVRAKLDPVGVVMLATVVGLAGGITRDVLIGTPPATFRDWRYLAAAAAAGGVCFFAGRGGEAGGGRGSRGGLLLRRPGAGARRTQRHDLRCPRARPVRGDRRDQGAAVRARP